MYVHVVALCPTYVLMYCYSFQFLLLVKKSLGYGKGIVWVHTHAHVHLYMYVRHLRSHTARLLASLHSTITCTYNNVCMHVIV